MADSGAAGAGVLGDTEPFYQRLERELPAMRATFNAGRPFRHIAIDNFCDPAWLTRMLDEEEPTFGNRDWFYHRHYDQKTYSKTIVPAFSPVTRALLDVLGSARFHGFMEGLTGTAGLHLDKDVEDGGLAWTGRGGFLGVHTDMLGHPKHETWRRRYNLILYLNRDWKPEYNGQLELWDPKVTRCEASIEPLFNRAAIFEVTNTGYHGVPKPIACPEGMYRKTFALYYFTEGAARNEQRYFYFKPRPGEPLRRRVLIAANNIALQGFEWSRKRLGVTDAAVDRVLWWLPSRARRKD